jgi:hypothetical protein
MPDGSYSYKKVSRADWITFIPNAHSGYISLEQYEENQERLKQGSQAHGNDRRKSPPREGPALLQGLILCGICGNRMTVRYHSRGGKRIPDYVCQRNSIEKCLSNMCQCIPGKSIDQCISDLLIETVTPLALEVALSVQEELQSRYQEADELRKKHVERIKYETELAKRRYLRVDPDNRLVAVSLEADWNEKLRALTEAQDAYEKQAAADRKALSVEQREQIQALSSDFPKLWQNPNVSDRERKRIVRLIIEDVCLKRDHVIHVDIRFCGGATRSIELPLPMKVGELRKTPKKVIEELDRLLENHTNSDAAKALNNLGLRTVDGKFFSAPNISNLIRAYNLKSRHQRLRDSGFLTSKEIAKILGTYVDKVHELHKAGYIE